MDFGAGLLDDDGDADALAGSIGQGEDLMRLQRSSDVAGSVGDVGGEVVEARGGGDATSKVIEALIELVVTGGRDLKASSVQDVEGRLVVADGGHEGRTADGVAVRGEENSIVAHGCAAVFDDGEEIGGELGVTIDEAAVEVVEREDLVLRVIRGAFDCVRNRRGRGDNRARETEGSRSETGHRTAGVLRHGGALNRHEGSAESETDSARTLVCPFARVN